MMNRTDPRQHPISSLVPWAIGALVAVLVLTAASLFFAYQNSESSSRFADSQDLQSCRAGYSAAVTDAATIVDQADDVVRRRDDDVDRARDALADARSAVEAVTRQALAAAVAHREEVVFVALAVLPDFENRVTFAAAVKDQAMARRAQAVDARSRAVDAKARANARFQTEARQAIEHPHRFLDACRSHDND